MDREKAIAIIRERSNTSPWDAGTLVDALAALGILKLEERTPKQAIKDTLAEVVLLPHELADPTVSGWRVGPYGSHLILKALDKAGFNIVRA